MILARTRWLAQFAAVFAAAAVVVQPAAAELKIAYTPQGDAGKLQMIALRPNAIQPIYLKYFNPGPGARKNVKISMEQFDGDKGWREIGKAVIQKVDVKKDVPVKFDGIPTPKDPAAAWPKLDGPPFVLRFIVDDGTTKEPVKIEVPVKLQEPREYVKVVEARYDPNRRRLSFKLKSDEPLDPPCPVELVLQSSAVPGLIQNSAGTFKQKLNKENQEVELSADNVQFEGGVPPVNGRVYLTVDGFERAFLFNGAFANGTLTVLKDEMRARLVAPRYSRPQAKIPVTIEIDVRSQADGDEDPMQRYLVDLQFDLNDQGNYKKTPGSPYRGLRDQTIEYKSEGDALVFKTKVKDRVVELDTEAINGKRTLKVKLFSKADQAVPLADEQDSIEKVALFLPSDTSKFAPLKFDKTNDSVLAVLVLDSTPAEELKITGIPAKARPEDKFSPRLQVKPRNESIQAPIEKVYFFFGEADKEHKIPEKITGKFEAFLDKDKFYVLKEDMIVPADSRGKLFVSAQVETMTGVLMSKKEATTVRSKDANDSESDVLTTISGTVGRGELMQKDVTVFLAKAKPEKGDVPKQTKSKDDGKFEFADVPPGDYVLSARKLDTVSRVEINVPKGTEKIDGVKMKLTVR